MKQSRLVFCSAFVWSFAEATFFFIVPDVLLTGVALRSFRGSLLAGGYAILGAVLGGSIMYLAGLFAPEHARVFLLHIPGIGPDVIDHVRVLLSEHGLCALLLGPLGGLPYKVFAVLWGADRGDFLALLLVSIPARGLRFVLSCLIASIMARLLGLWKHRPVYLDAALLVVFWIGFYLFYFAHFGW